MRIVADLTSNERHVLLTYNGYSVYIYLAVLLLLHTRRIAIFTLPPRFSGRTQSQDVIAFCVFKKKINKFISITLLSLCSTN